jgi:hypothetical protein
MGPHRRQGAVGLLYKFQAIRPGRAVTRRGNGGGDGEGVDQWAGGTIEARVAGFDHRKQEAELKIAEVLNIKYINDSMQNLLLNNI